MLLLEDDERECFLGCWSGDAALLMMLRDLNFECVLHDLLCPELEPDLLPDEDLGDGDLLLWHDGDLLTDTVLLPGVELYFVPAFLSAAVLQRGWSPSCGSGSSCRLSPAL